MADQSSDLINLLLTVGKTIRKKIGKNNLAGMTFGQLNALHYIKNQNRPTMKIIAEEFNITPPSVTDLVMPFIARGLVKKIYDKNDRRKIHLALTVKGNSYLKEYNKKIAEKMKKLIANLNERQIKNFKEILQIILKNSEYEHK